MSCVLGALGNTLGEKYMTQRSEDEQWSMLVFPKENPPQREFALWKLALCQVVLLGGIADRFRRLTHEGYMTWDK